MGLSLRSRVFRRLAPVFVSSHDATIEQRRKEMERASFGPKARGFDYMPMSVAGVPALRASAKSSTTRHIAYFHGGGYTLGSADSHRNIAARLARYAGAGVTLIDYRLAPEHPFPAAFDDAVAATKAIVEEFGAGNVAIAGDSAGGGVTLATLCALAGAGEPMPACAFVMSPWTDLTASGETMTTKADIDPMIPVPLLKHMADLYAGDTSKDDPRVSPHFADLAGLPPVLIQVGTDEVLLDDALRFADAAKAAGVDVTIDVWHDLWHVFQGFVGYMPEANRAMQQGGAFIAAHTR